MNNIVLCYAFSFTCYLVFFRSYLLFFDIFTSIPHLLFSSVVFIAIRFISRAAPLYLCVISCLWYFCLTYPGAPVLPVLPYLLPSIVLSCSSVGVASCLAPSCSRWPALIHIPVCFGIPSYCRCLRLLFLLYVSFDGVASSLALFSVFVLLCVASSVVLRHCYTTTFFFVSTHPFVFFTLFSSFYFSWENFCLDSLQPLAWSFFFLVYNWFFVHYSPLSLLSLWTSVAYPVFNH